VLSSQAVAVVTRTPPQSAPSGSAANWRSASLNLSVRSSALVPGEKPTSRSVPSMGLGIALGFGSWLPFDIGAIADDQRDAFAEFGGGATDPWPRNLRCGA